MKAVMEIEKASFSSPWKRSYFLYDMNRLQAFCLVAKENKRLVGYLIAWRIEDQIHLANIAVHPAERKKGFGSQLLNIILEIGAELKCQNIYLEVRISNTIAQNFYRKLGFAQTFIQKHYYHVGEDALIFVKEF